MTESSSSIQRYDALVRSERYFTATLLPAILFHDNLRGVERFLDIVDERAKTEREKSGEPRPKARPAYDFDDVEIITEFHIGRDLTFAGMRLDVEEGERRDAPDVVIVAGQELVVCEGKFFSDFGRLDLNEQLLSQRRQVRHLFHHRPDLRAYRHVAILPEVLEGSVDADAVLTWDDIGDLAERLLGTAHYVTQRLRDAVATYRQQRDANPGSGPNYDEKLPFDLMFLKCQEFGNAISVGHWGGEADLRTRDAAYILGKQWKYRTPENAASVIASNWLPGARWLEIVDSLRQNTINSPITSPIIGGHRICNYDGRLLFQQMRDKCQEPGNALSIGHEGGAANLRRCSAAEVRAKVWKYRTPQNRGNITPSNWLPGALWLEIVNGLT